MVFQGTANFRSLIFVLRKMVHTFNFDDKYYLFDSESGSLHICDLLTSEIIKKINGEKYNLDGVPEEVVADVEEEIAELKKQGLIKLFLLF